MLRDFSPFLKFRYTVKAVPSLSQVFKLICSLPLLEDLKIPAFGGYGNDDDGTSSEPSTSPPLTGTLQLQLLKDIEPITRRLLGLPGGLRFRRFKCVPLDIHDDARWITALVERCAETLEYFHIGYRPFRESHSLGVCDRVSNGLFLCISGRGSYFH